MRLDSVRALQPRGFTLIELMVVIFICGILVSLGVFSFKQLAQEGKVEAAAREHERAVYQARAHAMRRDKPIGVAFNSTLHEANLVNPGNTNISGAYGSGTILRYWHPDSLPYYKADGKSPDGPCLYSDAPQDQWYCLIGPAPVYDKSPFTAGGVAYKYRGADAANTPDQDYWDKSPRRDLCNTDTGEWDVWDIQIGKRHYLPEGVRWWRGIDFEEWKADGEGVPTSDPRCDSLVSWPDGICAARMFGASRIADNGSARTNLVAYPRGTFDLNEVAAYAARGGRFSHIYSGMVTRDKNTIRRVITYNPITGVVFVKRDWDLPR